MSLKEKMAEAKARLDKETQWLKLEKGEEFTMEVVSFRIVDGEYGAYPIVEGTLEDGSEGAFSAGRSVVKARLLDNPPEKGDILSIRYLGEKTSEKTGREYHDYKVVLMPGEESKATTPSAADKAVEEW